MFLDQSVESTVEIVQKVDNLEQSFDYATEITKSLAIVLMLYLILFHGIMFKSLMIQINNLERSWLHGQLSEFNDVREKHSDAFETLRFDRLAKFEAFSDLPEIYHYLKKEQKKWINTLVTFCSIGHPLSSFQLQVLLFVHRPEIWLSAHKMFQFLILKKNKAG